MKEGFEVWKSPNCVNSIIKKELKREEFLNKKKEKLNREVISEYTDFDIVFVERY